MKVKKILLFLPGKWPIVSDILLCKKSQNKWEILKFILQKLANDSRKKKRNGNTPGPFFEKRKINPLKLIVYFVYYQAG